MPYENGVWANPDVARQRGKKGGYGDLAQILTVRPLSQWPGARDPKQKRAQFSAPWARSCQLLADELRRVKATNCALQVMIEERHFRNDGLPRADAPTFGPGVVLSFTHPTAGALMYPCDRYDDWRDNLHALALSLEALRAVDRYGVTKNAEQYRGWKALPASIDGPMDHEEAVRVIAAESGADVEVVSNRVTRAPCIRKALFNTHPDQGGNPDAFHRVQRARKALDA